MTYIIKMYQKEGEDKQSCIDLFCKRTSIKQMLDCTTDNKLCSTVVVPYAFPQPT